MNAQVTSLAAQLGYDGSLTVGALEDEIRFYQRRTVEACLELGKRLLLLKELAPHGEFVQRTELLGISKRMSQKFMSATLKFAKTNSSSLLQKAGNQTKLLELVMLDDDEIETPKIRLLYLIYDSKDPATPYGKFLLCKHDNKSSQKPPARHARCCHYCGR